MTNRTPEVRKGLGSLRQLEGILVPYGGKKILVVTGKKSFEISGARSGLKDLLGNYNVTYFSDFDANPKLDDAMSGVKVAIDNKVDLILCIGGGSVIDMAKLIKAFYSEPEHYAEIAKGERKVSNPNIPIIAIPTTAGSGSESTHFAVVYIGHKKYSVADVCLLPTAVILDGELVISASRYQKACNVLDAISQSIESSWAVGSSKESQELAFSGLKLCIDNFEPYVNDEQDRTASQAMLEAANLAGQAINVSKTTAAHAWSYGFSSHHGISHGHAVWMTLPAIFEIHGSVGVDAVNEPRGNQHLKYTMGTLKRIMKIEDGDDFREYFSNMLGSIGIKADMTKDLKLSVEDRIFLAEAVNLERMLNNPVDLNHDMVTRIFQL